MNDLVKQPWDKKKWQGGVIRPAFPFVPVFLLAFSLVWLGMAAAILADPKLSFRPWNRPATALVITSGAGLVTLLPGLLGLLRWAKWRGVVLMLAEMPVIIGSRMKGRLLLPGSINDRTAVSIRLRNEQLTTTGSGKHRRTDVSVLYEDAVAAETNMLSMEQDRYSVPVEFVIPYDTIDATSSKGNVSYRWRMVVMSQTPGLDMNVPMELPVFHTPKSDPSIRRPELAPDDISKRLGQAGTFRHICVLREAGEEHYVTGGARVLGHTLVGYIFTIAILIAAAVFILIKTGLIHTDDQHIRNVPWIVPGGLLLTTAVFWAVVANMGARREVWVSGGWLFYRSGVRRRVTKVACANIVQCRAELNRPSSGICEAFYSVRVYYSDGEVHMGRGLDGCRRIEIAVAINDKMEAEWLAGKVQERVTATS